MEKWRILGNPEYHLLMLILVLVCIAEISVIIVLLLRKEVKNAQKTGFRYKPVGLHVVPPRSERRDEPA